MRAQMALYLDLIRWNRPAGWLLLLWPTLTALWLAAGGWPGWHLLTVFVLGTIFMRSAGCCINDVADRHFDKHVKRTAQRPITSGRVSVPEALAVGAVFALLSLGLVLSTTWQAVAWSLPAVLVTVLYPYAKRHIAMPQAVLGVAFGCGIPIAYAAVLGTVPWLALGLCGANLLWVLAYDTEYAMVDRDDDLKIGMKTSAITLGAWDVPAIVLFYLGALGLWLALLWPTLGGPWLASATLVSLAQVAWHWVLIRQRTREGCFRAFRLNHWLGLTQFAGVLAASTWPA